MAKFLAAFTLSLAVLVPGMASASPVQLNFTGRWLFLDPQFDNPGFWAAMSAVGVGNQSPLLYSLVVDDFDTDSSGTVGAFNVLGSKLQVGSLTLTSGASSLLFNSSVGGGVTMLSSWAGGPVGSYNPGFLQLSASAFGAGLASDTLSSLIGNWNTAGSNALFIGFNGASNLGLSSLTLSSVRQVPGPGALVVIAAAVPGFVWHLRRRRKSSRPN